MKLITRNTDYAIRALVYLAKNPGKIVAVPELISKTAIPRPFIRSIMQALGKKGFVASFKGKGGGFLLKLNPEKISIVDVMEVFQGRFNINECTFKKHKCPHIYVCKLRKKLCVIDKVVGSKLSVISINSIK